MRQVGIRDARQNLSVLLGHVRAGQEVVITDRGQPVARLLAPLPLAPRHFTGRATLRRSLRPLEPPLAQTIGGGAAATWAPGTAAPSSPLYLDASALAKLYTPERGSAALERSLRGRRDLTVSDLAATELLTALALREPGPAALARVGAALHEDLESGVFRRADLSPRTHRTAERLAVSLGRRAPARGTALLHLALAVVADATTIVTFDTQLAEAAARLGLRACP